MKTCPGLLIVTMITHPLYGGPEANAELEKEILRKGFSERLHRQVVAVCLLLARS
jgi:hypothetical protein